MTQNTDSFQQIVDFQREAFEPFRAFTTIASQTFERLARQNYALLGDCMEFAVAQAKLPTQVKDLNEYVGQQITQTRAFGETLAKRTHEYAEIARTAQDATVAATDKRAPKKAA
jgi:hypothetical protein